MTGPSLTTEGIMMPPQTILMRASVISFYKTYHKHLTWGLLVQVRQRIISQQLNSWLTNHFYLCDHDLIQQNVDWHLWHSITENGSSYTYLFCTPLISCNGLDKARILRTSDTAVTMNTLYLPPIRCWKGSCTDSSRRIKGTELEKTYRLVLRRDLQTKIGPES